jgi:RNA polymerase sigma-70 factor (ECF subfamily)
VIVGPHLVGDASATDVELVARVAAGDRDAFQALYERYAGWVNGVAFVATRSAESAEEVTQEVFVRVWRYARGFDPTRGRVEAWLFAVIRNRVRDRLRLAGRAATLHQELADELPDPVDHRPEHALSDGQVKHAVRTALDLLPPEQRTVVELCFFQGLTHREAADRLGVALGTLKGRVRLALDKLRTRLQEDA